MFVLLIWLIRDFCFLIDFKNKYILEINKYMYIEKKLKCLKYVRWDILMKNVLKLRGGNVIWKISLFLVNEFFFFGIFFVILFMGKI